MTDTTPRQGALLPTVRFSPVKRMRAPASSPERRKWDVLLPPTPPLAAPLNYYAVEIAQLLGQVCQITGLSPFRVVSDWIGMVHDSLNNWAQYVHELFEHDSISGLPNDAYNGVGERYKSLDLDKLLDKAFHLLIESSMPGLEGYLSSDITPDVIGQVFTLVLNPGRPWWPFFPAWSAVLKMVGKIDQETLCQPIYLALATATQRYKEAAGDNFVPLIAGETWIEWWIGMSEFLEPQTFTHPIFDSSAVVLAVASRFSDWMTQHGLAIIQHTAADPLLAKLVEINCCLYRINGWEKTYMTAASQISQVLQENFVAVPREALLQASALRPVVELGPADSFEQLFRDQVAVETEVGA